MLLAVHTHMHKRQIHIHRHAKCVGYTYIQHINRNTHAHLQIHTDRLISLALVLATPDKPPGG